MATTDRTQDSSKADRYCIVEKYYDILVLSNGDLCYDVLWESKERTYNKIYRITEKGELKENHRIGKGELMELIREILEKDFLRKFEKSVISYLATKKITMEAVEEMRLEIRTHKRQVAQIAPDMNKKASKKSKQQPKQGHKPNNNRGPEKNDQIGKGTRVAAKDVQHNLDCADDGKGGVTANNQNRKTDANIREPHKVDKTQQSDHCQATSKRGATAAEGSVRSITKGVRHMTTQSPPKKYKQDASKGKAPEKDRKKDKEVKKDEKKGKESKKDDKSKTTVDTKSKKLVNKAKAQTKVKDQKASKQTGTTMKTQTSAKGSNKRK